MKNLLLTFLLLCIRPCYSASTSFSFGPVQLGANVLNLDLSTFHIQFEESCEMNLEAKFLDNSLQWVRTENNLLIPRARVHLSIDKVDPNLFVKFQNQIVIPSISEEGHKSVTEIFINLFNPSPIEIYLGDKRVNTLIVRSEQAQKNAEDPHLIDHSCFPYHLNVDGIENEYLSVGCRMEKIGKIGSEKPLLHITWAATNFESKEHTPPPFSIIMTQSGRAHFNMTGQDKKEEVVQFSAKLPKRMSRFKTAYGFGPYIFGSNVDGEESPPSLAPAFMLYGKLDLLKTTSLRAFDALVINKAIFNNLGLYFAYEVSAPFDGRISIVPLLGAQFLTFSHEWQSKIGQFTNKMIYPQGFEVVYRHAFNIKNYHIIYGMFLSTQKDLEYTNSWIRWGKGPFWELNYIEYGEEGQKTSMWGLSIGLPLISLF